MQGKVRTELAQGARGRQGVATGQSAAVGQAAGPGQTTAGRATGGRARVRGTRLVAQAGDWLYHFDSTGRLLMAARPHQVIRRGFDNRLLRVSTPRFGMKAGNTGVIGAGEAPVTATEIGGMGDAARGTAAQVGGMGVIDPTVGALVYRHYDELTPGEAADFYRAAYAAARAALRAMLADTQATGSTESTRWLEWERRLATWTPEALAEDADAFRAVYSPISILPPDMYHSLVVQVTLGCSYNKCLFCDFYRDRRFHIRSELELESHLDRLVAFLGPRVADRKSVFLADGNAFVVPTERLLKMITQIRRRLSGDGVDGVSHRDLGHGDLGDRANDIEFNAFMDTFTLEYKTPEDLRRIHDAGLRTVYTGLETGSNRLRRFLAKPGTADEAVEALNLLKAGGIRLGVILLVGVGGPAAASEHLAETLEALRKIEFTEGDVIYLSPFVDPDDITGYRETLAAAGYDSFTRDGLAAELARWRMALATMQMTAAGNDASGGGSGSGNARPLPGRATPMPAKVTLYSILEHIYG